MAQLTKGMYGSEFDHEQASRLFDLCCGQMRCPELTHNSGWYNKAGEKIGWGDLSAQDFRRIADGIEDGELFIVLGESDSFWNFVTQPGTLGCDSQTAPTEQAPGVDYVARKAMYIVAKDRLYCVAHYRKSAGGTLEADGLTFQIIAPDDVKALMAAGTDA